jgi:protein-disulfide isomerase
LRAATTSPIPLLTAWASQVGVDQAAFNTCLSSGKYNSLVLGEKAIAQQLKIPGTPSIFVGDQEVRGAGGGVPTVEEIGKAVDTAIAKKQGR